MLRRSAVPGDVGRSVHKLGDDDLVLACNPVVSVPLHAFAVERLGNAHEFAIVHGSTNAGFDPALPEAFQLSLLPHAHVAMLPIEVANGDARAMRVSFRHSHHAIVCELNDHAVVRHELDQLSIHAHCVIDNWREVAAPLEILCLFFFWLI